MWQNYWDVLAAPPAQALFTLAIFCVVWTLVGSLVMKYFAPQVPVLNHAAILFLGHFSRANCSFGFNFSGWHLWHFPAAALGRFWRARALRCRLARDATSLKELRCADKISGRWRQGGDDDGRHYVADRHRGNRDNQGLRLA